MNKLIWQLFEMIRELLPPTQNNTHRLSQWAQAFHEHAKYEEDDPLPPPTADQADEMDEPEQQELEELDEPAHGRSKRKRK